MGTAGYSGDGIAATVERWGAAAVGLGIYTLAETAAGPTKIGITRNDRARFAAIQTGNPRPLVSGMMLPCDHAADIERRVHDRLKEYRLVGEWFAVPLAVADQTIEAVVAEFCGGEGERPAPLLMGECEFCDRRRQMAAVRLKRFREKRKES